MFTVLGDFATCLSGEPWMLDYDWLSMMLRIDAALWQGLDLRRFVWVSFLVLVFVISIVPKIR